MVCMCFVHILIIYVNEGKEKGRGRDLKGMKELLMYEYLIGIINGKLATIVDGKKKYIERIIL